MHRWLPAVLIFFSLIAHGQNADSLARSIDSSARQIQHTYESLEDSLYRLKMQRPVNQKGEDLDKFLADYKEYKEKEKRRTYVRVGGAIIFAAALVYGIARKRRQNKSREN
jgi:hypothetical protein